MQIQTSQNTLEWGRIEKVIAALDERFPDVFPAHHLSEKQISYRAGQLSKIRLLKQQLSD